MLIPGSLPLADHVPDRSRALRSRGRRGQSAIRSNADRKLRTARDSAVRPSACVQASGAEKQPRDAHFHNAECFNHRRDI